MWVPKGESQAFPLACCRLWMWAQHIALTEFMGVVLTCCVGTVLEMHARQSFVRTHCLEDLDWQPGVLPRLMMLVLEHLRKVKSRLLDMLGVRTQQQAKGNAGKQSYPAKGMEQQECKQLPSAVSPETQDSRHVESAMRCTKSAPAAPAGSLCCRGTLPQAAETAHISTACCPGPASRCPALTEQPRKAEQAQQKVATACPLAVVEAEMGHAHRQVSLAVGYQGTVCESSDSLSSPASSSCDSGSDADVSEAQKVCCGVQGMQAQACQKLLNKGKALDSKCKQLACRYASHIFSKQLTS